MYSIKQQTNYLQARGLVQSHTEYDWIKRFADFKYPVYNMGQWYKITT